MILTLSQSVLFIMCDFLHLFVKQVVSAHLQRDSQNASRSLPAQSGSGTRLSAHSWSAGSPEATIPPSLPPILPFFPSCRPCVLSFTSVDCVTRLPPGLLFLDPLITHGTHRGKSALRYTLRAIVGKRHSCQSAHWFCGCS